MHDEIEKAEFNYWVAVYYYHIMKPILAIQYAMKVKEIFINNAAYELKIAACVNYSPLSKA